ncbi:MAG TPA: transketolase [Chloroflexi bacterium]|nr:transketolase [Chloroflexota bacterium]
MDDDLIKRCSNIVRGLSMDAVQEANSGHPGLPMGMADAAVALWSNVMKFDPLDPNWCNRDRFVLSAGHGSMLLYALLHLSGYDIDINSIKNFRQLKSITPGHPEFGHTPGVDTTTGPLGQGLANAVGMAMAERSLAARFNKPEYNLFDHYTYVIVGDGCLMEGISHEACSFAGHNRLGRLIVLWDNNSITIDGSTNISTSDDVLNRFRSYGWHTAEADGHSTKSVIASIRDSQKNDEKPSLISCRTVIGYGSPNRSGKSKAHGEPLGVDEVRLTKISLGLPDSEKFYIDLEAISPLQEAASRGSELNKKWQIMLSEYEQDYPEDASELKRSLDNDFSISFDDVSTDFLEIESIATRAASGKVLEAIIPSMPNMIGGSADLTGSNNTFVEGQEVFDPDNFGGSYVNYGVREHAMGSIMNGLSLHGGIIPYGGTFLVFSDYMRPAIRLAAMMGIQVVYVFTHDSIGVGEDGPTHQPVEHLMSLRTIPGLTVIRPADAMETKEAWKVALENANGPTALLLTRQKLKVLNSKCYKGLQNTYDVNKGAYVIRDSKEDPEVIIMGSGSEVHIALEAATILEGKGIDVRVVSFPSFDLFDKQNEQYKNSVLNAEAVRRVAIEAGVSMGWHRFVGDQGRIIAIDRYGASAPAEQVYEMLGLTVTNVVSTVEEMM